MKGKGIEKFERINKWLRGGKSFPYVLEMRITKKCNLKCLTCFQRNLSRPEQKNELKLKEWEKAIKEAAKLQVRECHIIGGGEALCKPRVTLKVMRLVKEFNMFGFLVTNGTLFHNKIVKEIVKMNWDSVGISLDGPNPKINDYLRGKGTFERCIRTINLFNFWKNRLKMESPKISLLVVVSKVNYKMMPEMVKLSKKLKLSNICFQGLMIHNPFCEKIQVKRDEVEPYVNKALNQQKKLEIDTNLDDFLEQFNILKKVKNTIKRKEIFCFKPLYYIGIREDGNVEPCPTSEPNVSLENIRKNSLKDIWFGESFEKLREDLLNFKLPQRCFRCCPSNIINEKRIKKELFG